MSVAKSAVLVCGWDITDVVESHKDDDEFSSVIVNMRSDGAYTTISTSMIDLTHIAGVVVHSYEDTMPHEFVAGELNREKFFEKAYENIKRLEKWYKPEGLPRVLLAVAA